MAVSILKPPNGGLSSETAVAKPFQKRNGYKIITAICNGHSPADKIASSGLTVFRNEHAFRKITNLFCT